MIFWSRGDLTELGRAGAWNLVDVGQRGLLEPSQRIRVHFSIHKRGIYIWVRHIAWIRGTADILRRWTTSALARRVRGVGRCDDFSKRRTRRNGKLENRRCIVVLFFFFFLPPPFRNGRQIVSTRPRSRDLAHRAWEWNSDQRFKNVFCWLAREVSMSVIDCLRRLLYNAVHVYCACHTCVFHSSNDILGLRREREICCNFYFNFVFKQRSLVLEIRN